MGMVWFESSAVLFYFLILPLDTLDLDLGIGDLVHGEGSLEHEQGNLDHG